MLNHAKVIKALEQLSHNIDNTITEEVNALYELWLSLLKEKPMQAQLLLQAKKNETPTWSDDLSKTIDILPFSEPYEAVGIDGSQIYPDRHCGIFCSVVNVGTVALPYLMNNKVTMVTEPTVFINDRQTEQFNSIDVINARRHEMELQGALRYEQSSLNSGNNFRIYFFDGALIFWHLASKDQLFFNTFFNRSIQLLRQFYAYKLLTVWYISLPKSKELISLIQAAHKINPTLFPDHSSYFATDATILKNFIDPWQRTQFFASNIAIAQQYPVHLQPYFCYVNTGDEIGRIEMPAWIAHNELLSDKLVSIIVSQIQKGNGYPVVLAEAHEQAVIKGPDREFFFHLITKWSMEQNRKISISQKNSKKRRMSI